jgi:hypothetical protein
MIELGTGDWEGSAVSEGARLLGEGEGILVILAVTVSLTPWHPVGFD